MFGLHTDDFSKVFLGGGGSILSLCVYMCVSLRCLFPIHFFIRVSFTNITKEFTVNSSHFIFITNDTI